MASGSSPNSRNRAASRSARCCSCSARFCSCSARCCSCSARCCSCLATSSGNKYDERFSSQSKQDISPTKVNPNNQSDNINSLLLQRSASESDVTFNRLPSTRKEAENILALVPQSSRLSQKPGIFVGDKLGTACAKSDRWVN